MPTKAPAPKRPASKRPAPKTPKPKAVPPNGFVASAVELPAPSRNKAGRLESWQSSGWDAYDTLGEVRYPADWVGNVMSGARLCAARDIDGALVVCAPEHPASVAMSALYGGIQGQGEMLNHVGVHLSVAGECYITLFRGEWYVLACGKATQQNKIVSVDVGTEGGSQRIGPNDFVLRVWTPNKRDPTRPDSPLRANLGTIAQIRGYDAHIDAQLQSRLAGNGVLLLPSEITFATPPGMDPAATSADAFMAVLAKAMMTPISDPSSAAAVVPIVVTVPGEHLEKINHLTFWSELDDAVTAMREAAVKRYALGVDIPPEVLLGVSDSNHWNAWLSDESAIKSHIEPRLAVVTSAITTGYLRPALTGEVPPGELDSYYCIADTSGIRMRPNRSREAVELFDRGELAGAAMRRETGFQPEDAPSEEELRTWMLRKVATSASSPELVLSALVALGFGELQIAPGATGGLPSDASRTDTIPDLPERNPPALDRARGRSEIEPGLAAAAEVLLFRALERAGNRLRNMHPLSDTKAMVAHAVYTVLSGDADHLLAGSWDAAPEVLSRYCDDPGAVIEVLDLYARGLLASKRAPSSTVLTTLLATRPEMVGVGSG